MKEEGPIRSYGSSGGGGFLFLRQSDTTFLPVSSSSSSSSSSGRPLVAMSRRTSPKKSPSSLSLIGESERGREEAWRIKNYMARWIPTTLAFLCVCVFLVLGVDGILFVLFPGPFVSSVLIQAATFKGKRGGMKEKDFCKLSRSKISQGGGERNCYSFS